MYTLEINETVKKGDYKVPFFSNNLMRKFALVGFILSYSYLRPDQLPFVVQVDGKVQRDVTP